MKRKVLNIVKKNYIYLLIAVFFITLTSKLSPIYPINDWCDSNSFFTMGKSMIKGVSIYKDLFEQKGPFLYLIYGIGYLISNTSFIGVYLLEIVSFSIFLKIVNCILELENIKNKKLFLITLSAIITTSISFYSGGSAEEFCLPFITYGIYTLFKIHKKTELKPKDFLLNGLFFGLVFLIKFNLISFWFGFFIICIIRYRKEKLIKKILYFILGFLIPIIGFLIYFLCKKNLIGFIDAYFIKNIINYGNVQSNIKEILTRFLDGPTYFLTPGFGFIKNILLTTTCILSFMYAKKRKILVPTLLVFIFPYILICCQNNWYKYYNLPFCVFSIFGLVYLFEIGLFNKTIIKLLTLIMTITIFIIGENSYVLISKKEDYAQYKLSKVIEQYEDQSILNYGIIDQGLYLRTNKVPNIKYYHTMNFSNFKEMETAQEKYIKDKETNFLICCSVKDEDICLSENKYVQRNYKLLAKERHYKDYGLYYYLYVKK